ncbi:hypothetical protein [Halorientalis halophila]|uniref:hypothetical protein n=1 Tax=Halorientalis halophila TaxID=3108499 RepID=UPI00300A315C
MSTDRETIQEWAQDHDVVPVRVPGDRGESEQFRMVPESEMTADQERLEWEEFGDQVGEGDHVVVYHGAEGERPMEVMDRETAMTRADASDAEFEERLLEGETITTQIEETSVVETVVHEEATVESELIDRTVTDSEVVDVRLVDRECSHCDLTADEGVSDADGFDHDRYMSMAEQHEPGARGESERSVGEGRSEVGEEAETTTRGDESLTTGEGESLDADHLPYSAELDVRETWNVTRALTDQYTVESRVTGVEVSGDDTIEDHDIDVEGLHRSIVEGGLFDTEQTTEDVLAQSEIRSEFHEDDRIRTHFERGRTVEDEIVDRKRVVADPTSGERLGLEIIDSREIVEESEARHDTAAAAETEADAESAEHATGFSDDEIGKKVVDASGDDVGEVTKVEGSTMYVDPHHGITERIMASLGWGERDDDTYPIRRANVERVTDDRIELKEEKQIEETE